MDIQKGNKAMVHFIWPVMTERLLELPLTKVFIHFGHVRMYATPFPVLLGNIYIRFGTKLYCEGPGFW